MTSKEITILHERAEKEYNRWQQECESRESAYTRVCYDNICLAIANGEFDKYATILVQEEHPINYLYEEIMCAEDLFYSCIVDFINYHFEETEENE